MDLVSYLIWLFLVFFSSHGFLVILLSPSRDFHSQLESLVGIIEGISKRFCLKHNTHCYKQQTILE